MINDFTLGLCGKLYVNKTALFEDGKKTNLSKYEIRLNMKNVS